MLTGKSNMKTTHLLFYFTFLAVTSCSMDTKKNVYKEYDKQYHVAFITEKDDSILEDKTREYFADIKLDDSICSWKKTFFYRVYEDFSVSGTAHLIDTLNINFIMNDDFEISKILNYEEIYSHVKEFTDQLIETADESNREVLSTFIENVSLDSTNIINKNTQEISVFNVGLKFLFDESSFDTTIYKIERQEKFDILTYEYSFDAEKAIDEFRSHITPSNEIPANDYNIEVEICKDKAWNDLLYVKYSVYFMMDGIKHSTTTLIQKNI